jgi:DNA-directed RNA polymerase beta' subunit
MADNNPKAPVLNLSQNKIGSVEIGLASAETIRSWSKGEVKKPETINYRTFKQDRIRRPFQ